MDKLKIVYIGKDELFTKGVIETLDKFYEPEQIKLQSMFLEENEEDLVAKFVPEIIAKNPNIVIIDFSFKFDSLRLLARRLRLSLDSSKVTCVGVLNLPESAQGIIVDDELLISKEKIKQASLTQVPIIHYKGNDPQKIIFDAIYLNNKNTEMRGEYATYKNADVQIDAMYFSTLTHVLDDALIIESSISVKEDETLLLHSDYIYPVDNKSFLVTKKNQDFLSTKFLYRYRLDINFKNHGGLNQVDSKILKNYISSLDHSQSFSRLKLLMIQNELEVLTQIKEPINKYPYLIRYLTKFSTNMKMVQNFRPHIISVELSDPVDLSKDDIDDKDASQEIVKDNITLNEVESLINIIKKLDGYQPVIEVFNCQKLTDDFKEKVDYPYLMNCTSSMSFDLLMKMLEIFNSKREIEDPFENDPLIDSKEHPFSIYALSKESRLKHEIPIKITSLSEHEITFTTPIELPTRGVLFTESPVPFYFTVTEPIEPLERSRDGFHYFALINGISPSDGQELRNFVNTLFFKEKDEKKRQELEAFKVLNKQKEVEKSNSNKDDEVEDNEPEST